MNGLYLFESSERLQSGCLGDHGVAVSRAGLQRQSQARDGVNAQLRYGHLVIGDGERRLTERSVHGQRGLHLQNRQVLLLRLRLTGRCRTPQQTTALLPE